MQLKTENDCGVGHILVWGSTRQGMSGYHPGEPQKIGVTNSGARIMYNEGHPPAGVHDPEAVDRVLGPGS